MFYSITSETTPEPTVLSIRFHVFLLIVKNIDISAFLGLSFLYIFILFCTNVLKMC